MDEDNEMIRVRNEENYYCYDWIIKLKCLCDICLKYRSIQSPKFTTETIVSDNWSLRLYNFTGSELNLELQTSSQNYFSGSDCNLRISVRNKSKIACYSNEYQISLKSVWRDNICYHKDIPFIKFSRINNCADFIPEKVLTLVVEIFKPVSVISIDVRNPTEKEMALKNLQRSEELSDVTLVAGEREFRAHKAILVAHSPVFLAMFKHDVKETKENRVVIEDVSERVMEQILDYIYGGTVEKENFELVASEVLVAADKYNLQGLVRICENAMISSLDIDNVLKMLTTTEVYKLNLLKKSALNFILKNVKQVVETDEFKTFLSSSNYCLLKEIILGIATQEEK